MKYFGPLFEAARKAEAPEDAIFQKYAFGDARNDCPPELNTKDEDRLYKTLKAYFKHNTPIPVEAVDVIKQIIADGIYVPIFHAPKAKTIYRGMNVDENWLLSATNITKEELEQNPNNTLEASFTFTPSMKGGASSWTTSLKIANDFSSGRGKFDYNVILYAYVKDNPDILICGQDGLYRVIGFDIYKDEYEVLALADVKVRSIHWTLKTLKTR